MCMSACVFVYVCAHECMQVCVLGPFQLGHGASDSVRPGHHPDQPQSPPKSMRWSCSLPSQHSLPPETSGRMDLEPKETPSASLRATSVQCPRQTHGPGAREHGVKGQL